MSSRSVSTKISDSCYFGLQRVHARGMNSNILYYPYNNSAVTNSDNHGIRPLVSIHLRNCEITQSSTDSNTFDIVIK